MILRAKLGSARKVDRYHRWTIAGFLVTTKLPPFLAAVSDQIRRDSPPQTKNSVRKRNGTGITGLQTFHIVRHQERKWHVVVLRC